MKQLFLISLACSSLLFGASDLKVGASEIARDRSIIEDTNDATSDLLTITAHPEEQPVDGQKNPPPPYGDSACIASDPPLTALIRDRDGQILRTLTTQQNPILWFYLPYESPLKAEFSVTRGNSQTRRTITLPGQPGIIGIQLPPEAKLSAIGEDYEWNLEIICHPNKPSQNPYVYGQIRRIELPPLNVQNSQEKIKFFAKKGIWSDVLTTILIDLYEQNTEQAKQYLQQLLSGEGMQNLAQMERLKIYSFVEESESQTTSSLDR